MEKLSKDLFSHKVTKVSFVLMLLVVFIHSYNLGYSKYPEKATEDTLHNLNIFIQFSLCRGFTRVAVPLFFIISGYFFFLTYKNTLSSYTAKLKSRIKSLAIPFLFWSILMFLLFYVAQSISFTKSYFADESTLVTNLNAMGVLQKVFIMPIPYQLWFIRDLFLLVLISPLIYLLTSKTKGFWIIVLVFPWFLNADIPLLFSYEPLLFFAFGSFLAIITPQLTLISVTKKTAVLLLLLWVILVITRTTLLAYYDMPLLQNGIHKTGVLIGIMAFWLSFDHLFDLKSSPTNQSFYRFSFFLFCFHEPFLTITRKVLLKMLGKSEASLIMIYFGAAAFIIFTSIILGMIIKKHLPKVYSFTTGGR